ncbi:MAG: hypothetical protein IID05_08515, partial [Gemmatimonadetes bacterium]|nr:hypothetical protein [Gemmatimonadota bacterium]
LVGLAVALAFGFVGGFLLGRIGSGMEARSFDLAYLDSSAVRNLVGPYVPENGMLEMAGNIMTVRGSRGVLDKIQNVLDEYDVPRPTVRLHFRLISRRLTTDSVLLEIEPTLRRALEWPGYHLTTETVMPVTVGARNARQTMGYGELSFSVEVADLLEADPGQSVRMAFRLVDIDAAWLTILDLPQMRMTVGDWNVLGTPMNMVHDAGGNVVSTGQHALILIVRPEYVLP